MNHFDANMIALIGLILFMGVFVLTFIKDVMPLLIGLLLVVLMVWGDDVCSRKDRLALYAEHFNSGWEIICKDDTAHPLLISKKQGWQMKGEYFFQGSKGVDTADDKCEIIGKTEPHCISVTTQVAIGTATFIGMLGWMVWVFRRIHKTKQNELKKTVKAAEAMAPLYESDPELKEWTEFAGDHFEEMEQYTQVISKDEKDLK